VSDAVCGFLRVLMDLMLASSTCLGEAQIPQPAVPRRESYSDTFARLTFSKPPKKIFSIQRRETVACLYESPVEENGREQMLQNLCSPCPVNPCSGYKAGHQQASQMREGEDQPKIGPRANERKKGTWPVHHHCAPVAE